MKGSVSADVPTTPASDETQSFSGARSAPASLLHLWKGSTRLSCRHPTSTLTPSEQQGGPAQDQYRRADGLLKLLPSAVFRFRSDAR